MSPFHRLNRAAVVIALLLIPTARAHTQVTGTVTAFAGYYRPFGHFDPASVYTTDLPERPEDLRAVAWGGAGHLAIGNRFGVTAQVAKASSRVPEVITPVGPLGPTDASVLLATLQGQYAVSSTPRAQLWLNAGPGLVHHGGTAYARHGSPTSVAGAIGTTLVVPVAPHLQFTANATVLLYVIDVPMPPNLRLNPGRLEHGVQRDALLHAGLSWRPL
jgi:hypothetical protein